MPTIFFNKPALTIFPSYYLANIFCARLCRAWLLVIWLGVHFLLS
jgi:hypothetical protein